MLHKGGLFSGGLRASSSVCNKSPASRRREAAAGLGPKGREGEVQAKGPQQIVSGQRKISTKEDISQNIK